MDGDALHYSADGLPAGLSIDSTSGLVFGTLSVAGNSMATVTVNDGRASVSVSFTWTVTESNTRPTLTIPSAQSHEVGEKIYLPVSASDADGDSLHYSANGLPAGLSINSSTGIISGTPGTAGNHTVTVTVSDGEDRVSAEFSWEITE